MNHAIYVFKKLIICKIGEVIAITSATVIFIFKNFVEFSVDQNRIA